MMLYDFYSEHPTKLMPLNQSGVKEGHMSEWWYAEKNQKTGPVSETELRRLIQTGKINLTTLVWQEGMDRWLPIAEISTLDSLKESIPPPLPQKIKPDITDYPLATAWPRFFARTFDLWCEAILVGYVVGYVLALSSDEFIYWLKRPGSEFIFGLIIIPISLFFDAALYSFTGNTPGKMLLGLKVTTLHGRALEFVEYLIRNLLMWLSGLALGLPIINLITMSKQHKRLGRGEQATYDEGLDYRVRAKPIGGIRITGFSVLYICLLIMSTLNK